MQSSKACLPGVGDGVGAGVGTDRKKIYSEFYLLLETG